MRSVGFILTYTCCCALDDLLVCKALKLTASESNAEAAKARSVADEASRADKKRIAQLEEMLAKKEEA